MAAPQQDKPRISLTATLVRRLRDDIESGRYAAGEKLPTEPEMIRQHGVSRTVVREAIAALRADGLVESRHGVGVFVLQAQPAPSGLDLLTQVSDKISDIIEELELRAGVEIEAAGLAAQRSSPAQEAEIQACVDAFAADMEAGRATDEADFAFHMAVARATNNARFEAFLAHLGRRTIPRVKFRSALGGVDPLPNRDHELNAEHARVADAIFARDAEAARDAMRQHLVGGMERYRAITRSPRAARAKPGDS
ncbi:FadR/GntR family transcriptional regulator [Pararhizobium haloflavum]|uniref:FadR/GntR family transcriptional regulator n=1 Tax=Pararhizobium haloflavum TaxID=2037914 RepID=UPI000C17AD93|nr:FadR/GntR family transcriptional regulator [Pararhizobium haloflavum]